MGEDDDYDERRVRERAIAALIGFVAGDAYGAAVEHGLQPFSSREASRVTDATQLMLATGEGLAPFSALRKR
jgi:ADP-ribosylglycohydrolase